MKIPTLLPWLFLALALPGSTPTDAQSGVSAVLPNGREIRPVGTWIPLAPYPFALAVRPDGGQLAVPSIGFPFALNVIDTPADGRPTVRRMPDGDKNDPNVEVHAGLAYSPDGTMLYVATGDSGKVRAYSTADWKVTGEVSLDGECDGKTYAGSFAATLVVSADGAAIYVLDQGNWRVVILDAHRLHLDSCIATGAYPFGLALSPDGKRLYVTNSGLFEYQTIPGADSQNPLATGLRLSSLRLPLSSGTRRNDSRRKTHSGTR